MEQEALVIPRTVEIEDDFDRFYRAEHVRLYRSLLLITGSRTEAEDLAHEAFVRVLERWDRVSVMEWPRSYLYRTAFNLHRNAVRRSARWARRAFRERDVVDDFVPSALDRAEILRCLRGLPRGQLEAVVLAELVGMSSKEVGAVMGIDEQAVRARLHRARTTLREELTTDG